MSQINNCRICEKKYTSKFANLFDARVSVYNNESYMISYFEAMQQLTGMEVCVHTPLIYFNGQRWVLHLDVFNVFSVFRYNWCLNCFFKRT